jgi:uncharacterized phage-like protein YoqJ
MNRKSCAFTGHRPVDLPGQGNLLLPEARALYRQLGTVVAALHEEGVRDFYCGGALGFDTWAAQVVLALRRKDPEVRLHLVIPHWGQERAWPQEDQAEYTRILREANTSHVLRDEYQQGCMQQRNRELVDRAEILVAYCVKETGGSAYTVKYARKKGRRVLLLGQQEQLNMGV